MTPSEIKDRIAESSLRNMTVRRLRNRIRQLEEKGIRQNKALSLALLQMNHTEECVVFNGRCGCGYIATMSQIHDLLGGRTIGKQGNRKTYRVKKK